MGTSSKFHGSLLDEILVSLKVKLQALALLRSNTTPWVFFTFLKLYKWYQIAQNITDVDCLDKEGTPCSKVKCDWLAYLYVIELIVLNFWQAFQGETS